MGWRDLSGDDPKTIGVILGLYALAFILGFALSATYKLQ